MKRISVCRGADGRITRGLFAPPYRRELARRLTPFGFDRGLQAQRREAWGRDDGSPAQGVAGSRVLASNR
jgi:hypothetical protein